MQEPNGVLEETAHYVGTVPAVAPRTQEGKDLFLRKSLELAKSFGYISKMFRKHLNPQLSFNDSPCHCES
jgi:hypothetical protein